MSANVDSLHVVIPSLWCMCVTALRRDIKPENLLLQSPNDDLALKIADFGFAKENNGNNLQPHCGSLCYMAPEILKHHTYGTQPSSSYRSHE